MIVIAHDIRSLHNVGAIFRNAAAFSVERVFLTGITATPPRKEIGKVALGAEELVAWESGTIEEVVLRLRNDGYAVIGLDNREGAESIESYLTHQSSQRIALVLGNEVEGIDDNTRQLLDACVEIPMGEKRSLNVSVASGIAMYVFTRTI